MKLHCKMTLGGLLFLLCFTTASINSFSQTNVTDVKKRPEAIRNLKVLSEEPDGKGNIVRVIQYSQGMMKITETTIVPRVLPIGNTAIKFNPDTLHKELVRLVVDKKRRCLMVYYRNRMLRAYKATFGPNPQLDKNMEGDRCTPEGEFKITNINPRSKFNKFMLINYPNETAWARFNKLKETGIIPKSARIGGDIGIHGIWNGGDDMIELGVGWTDGCVALKNKDIEELYSIVGVGTKVVIVKEHKTIAAKL
ncbi:MAG TPA: L,D-transpeptidase [Flavipsychrobacter sp.]|nr:L,D-transpeptidase [Flavipsychrobacter sp.]